MAVTERNLTSTGATSYTFPFEYLKTTDIKISVNGTDTTEFTVPTATSVQFNTGHVPASGAAIRIYRDTNVDNLSATFYAGSAIKSQDLNDNFSQNLFVTQEAKRDAATAWQDGDETINSSETWVSDNNKIATTGAIDGRVDAKIDTALTTDIVGGDRITVTDNSPSSGKITIKVTPSSIQSSDIADGTIVNNDINASAAIAQSKLNIADATASASGYMSGADKTKLTGIETAATADQTNAEIRAAVEAATDSNVFTDADHTKLNGIETAATADQTAAEIKTSYESNAQTNPLTDAEKAVIDGVTANTSELNKLDGVTASTTELNIVAGKSFKTSSGTLDTTSDTEIPSSKVIAAHVASSQTAIGGFVTIADEVSFPNTQPANGVVVSINNAAGVVVNGSGVSTTGKRVDNTTVTINGFPSSLYGETLAAGVGLIVVSTATANTYSYHKILTSETDVKQLSDDINDFNSRYRIASSAPSSNNDEGDLYFDTAANKMKVYNGSAWDDVASVGSFFVNTLSSSSGTGGGSATFNNNAYRFTLSNAGQSAQQHIVSINGVVQKPNSGTSQPSEGFAIDSNDIIFSAAPASGSDFFIVTCGSSVSIGTPSANSVNSSHIIDGSIVNGDISNSANIDISKLNTSGTASNSNYLRGDGTWSTIDLTTKASLTGATFTGPIVVADGQSITTGSSSGISIYHTAVNNGSAVNLNYIDDSSDGGIRYRSGQSHQFTGRVSPNHNELQAKFICDGAAELYHAGSKKIETTSSGINVTGQINVNGSALSAAPEITATASGAIAANDPVILNSDGTVSKPAVVSSVLGSKQEFSSNTPNYIDACYEPVNNKVVVVYSDQNDSNRIKAIAGTVDGSNKTITWGTAINLHTNTDDACSYPRITATNDSGWCVVVWHSAYDSNRLKGNSIQTSSSNNSLTLNGNSSNAARGLIISSNSNIYTSTKTYAFGVAWNTGSSGQAGGIVVSTNTGYTVIAKALVISGDGTLQRPGNQLTCFSNNLNRSVAIGFNPDNNTYLVASGDQSGDNVDVMVIHTNSSNNVTNLTGEVNATGTVGPTNVYNVAYAPVYKKFLVGYTQTNTRKLHGVLLDTDSITTSGGSSQTLAAGTIVTVDATIQTTPSHNMGGDISFDEDKRCWIMTWRGDASPNANTGAYNIIKYDGTTLSPATAAVFDSGNSRYSSVCYDPDTKTSLMAYHDSTSDGQIIVIVPEHNTLREKNFIGFAQAGYSNGATAKVSVVGNTSTQSSLTPASTYYVQTNGTISTTAGSPSVEAGIALSSTKLLIKG